MADLLTIRDVLFWFALGLVAVRVVYLWLRKGAERAEAVDETPVVDVAARRAQVSGASAEGLPVRAPDHQYVAHLRLVVFEDDWDDSMTKH